MTVSSAPAKLILCGEHAVVYGRPAIALPLNDVRAYAEATLGPSGSGLRIDAPDLQRAWKVHAQSNDPLSALVLAALRHFGATLPDLRITLTSAIPIASGMGSGAAIATALVRLLAAHFGLIPAPPDVSALVYASERRFHGTPSGIDNTVIAFEQPIWFQRSQPAAIIEPIAISTPFTLLIGDTGVRSPTRLPVGEVRRRWQTDQERYEMRFDQIAALTTQSRAALAIGDLITLGHLLNANQSLLEQIGVSSPELERLIEAARRSGALGAKLSGAGWGGVMLALVEPSQRAAVVTALRRAGATRVLETTVGGGATLV